MSVAQFVWCDLSTFDLNRACQFYGSSLNWTYNQPVPHREKDYTSMYSGNHAVAGIYTMPQFFQSIKMPSFWMPYIRVTSLDSVYARAEIHGAKGEIPPTAFDEQSRFALIRDPSGAGFTLYEGPDLSDGGLSTGFELHVESIDQVSAFYENLFGWTVHADPKMPGRYLINASSQLPVASMMELVLNQKGPKNYWCVIFKVVNVHNVVIDVKSNGGRILSEYDAALGYAMLEDNQGAMFCISEP